MRTQCTRTKNDLDCRLITNTIQLCDAKAVLWIDLMTSYIGCSHPHPSIKRRAVSSSNFMEVILYTNAMCILQPCGAWAWYVSFYVRVVHSIRFICHPVWIDAAAVAAGIFFHWIDIYTNIYFMLFSRSSQREWVFIRGNLKSWRKILVCALCSP